MDLAALGRFVPAVERRLRSEFRQEVPRWPVVDRRFGGILEEFTLRGGKRFRALMVLAGFHLATGRSPTGVLPAAAAMEHFQSWMLIHDDIIDHAELRRGGPTVHRSIARDHARAHRLGDPDAYGAGLGITLGDLEEPFTVAGLLAVRSRPERTLRAVSEYVRMARWTALGQALDLVHGSRPVGEVRESDVLEVHRLKSAIYTVVAPLRIGAIFGGGSPTLLDLLDAFGTDIGIAFQLRDDVLGAGFAGDAPGKSANDLVEGKRTLLVVRAWKEGGPADRAAIDRVLGISDAPPAAIAEAVEVLRRTGSLAYSERRIRALGRRAYARVDRAKELRPAGRALLHEIGERLIQRSA